ncbi:MAG: hypothetical protein EA421_01730 [Gemmatimonadales bacterium]|nr:MAG: hypothetical protein EA421_01730 [Gemmatimonadales bacterium]
MPSRPLRRTRPVVVSVTCPGPNARFTSARPLPLFGALLGVLFLGAGCGDLDSGTLVAVETDSPVPTLHLGRDLPSLPGLVDQWGRQLPLAELEALWTDSWALPEEEGLRIRAEAVQALVLVLEPRLDEKELEGEVRRVREALAGVSGALDGLELASLDGPVADAGQAGARASAALQAGDRAGALRWALEASDHLRRATPEVLALALIRETEEALKVLERSHSNPSTSATGRNSGAETYSEVTRARIHRLLLGARDALEEGDPARALRRAWYAVGLLESSSDGPDRRELDEPREEGP